MITQFKAARRAAVPLIAIETLDQQGTAKLLAETLNGSFPVLTWDIIRGMAAMNPPGAKVLTEFCKVKDPYSGDVTMQDPAIATANPGEMLAKVGAIAPKLGAAMTKACIIMFNAHRVMDNETVAQGVANLRGVFEASGATLVLLCPGISLPAELKQDVMVLEENPPTKEQVLEMVRTLCGQVKASYSGFDMPDEAGLDKIADTLVGLSLFSARQTLSACFIGQADGSTVVLDRRMLQEKQVKSVEQLDGLSVWRGKENFSMAKGCDNVVNFFKRMFSGRTPPLAVVFMDEIEKMMSGAQGGDSSGVSQKAHGELLRFMQDTKVKGMMFVGVSGGGKSMIAKAVGNEFGVPCFMFDMAATEDKFVGESGRKLRAALRAIKAKSQGRMLFVATSNNIGTISPELKRRFTYGTYYFDFLTPEARKDCWEYYLGKYPLEEGMRDEVDDKDWTGAEIEVCCQMAHDMNMPLSEAAKNIVPVAKTDADRIKKLRQEADGKYISAAVPGPYNMQVEWAGTPKEQARAVEVGGIVPDEAVKEFVWNK